jgi:hypothetical protein
MNYSTRCCTLYAVLTNDLTLYILIKNTSFTVRSTLIVWCFVVSICTTCSNITKLYVYTTKEYLSVQHHARNKHTEFIAKPLKWNYTVPSVGYEVNLDTKCKILAVWMLKSGFVGSFLFPSSSGPTEFVESDVCRTVHRNTFLSKTTQMHNISNLFYFGATIYILMIGWPCIVVFYLIFYNYQFLLISNPENYDTVILDNSLLQSDDTRGCIYTITT